MLKKSLILSTVLAMGACAYAMDDSIQDVQFETPGAYGATCHVYVDNVDHVVKPPQRVSIAKFRNDMIVDCLAPGNRRKKIFVEPGYQKSTGWNALNAGAGLPWDYASNAIFKWPDIVYVDFSDAPVVPQPLPAQDRRDVQDPATVPLEEFLPGRPRLNSEIGVYGTSNELQRRQKIEYGDAMLPKDTTSAFSEPSNPGRDKGDLQSVIDSIGIEKTTTSKTTVIAPDPEEANAVPTPPETGGATNVPSKTSGASSTPSTTTTTTTSSTTTSGSGLAPKITKQEATTTTTTEGATTESATESSTTSSESAGTGTTITQTGTKKTITVKSKNTPTELVPNN
jgi:hypothetical protein